MIAGRFEITIDEVSELVEAISMHTAARIAGLLGIDPNTGTDRNGAYDPNIDHRAAPRFGEHEATKAGRLVGRACPSCGETFLVEPGEPPDTLCATCQQHGDLRQSPPQ